MDPMTYSISHFPPSKIAAPDIPDISWKRRLHSSGRAFGRKAEGQTDVQVATSLVACTGGAQGQSLGFHIGFICGVKTLG